MGSFWHLVNQSRRYIMVPTHSIFGERESEWMVEICLCECEWKEDKSIVLERESFNCSKLFQGDHTTTVRPRRTHPAHVATPRNTRAPYTKARHTHTHTRACAQTHTHTHTHCVRNTNTPATSVRQTRGAQTKSTRNPTVGEGGHTGACANTSQTECGPPRPPLVWQLLVPGAIPSGSSGPSPSPGCSFSRRAVRRPRRSPSPRLRLGVGPTMSCPRAATPTTRAKPDCSAETPGR